MINKSKRFSSVIISLIFITAVFPKPGDKKLVSFNAIHTGTLLQKSDDPDKFYELPRLDTNIGLKVDGMVVSATVDQMFVNNSSAPIEAIYVFPLPDKAAVYDIQMLVNDRLIQSHIQEKKAAKQTYEKAKSEGKRASLTEQERPNVFTNSVANILPGDTIIIRLKYVDYLEYSDGIFNLRFPMVVGPRYIPGNHPIGYNGKGWAFDTEQVLDGSRITPPVLEKTGNKISLKVDLNAGLELGEVWSPTHTLDIKNRGLGSRIIFLNKKHEVPNRDFVLSFRLLNADSANTALFTSRAGDDRYFMLMTVPPNEGEYERLPKEVIYILDISGSMSGVSIRQAKKAISQAIRALNSDDYFNVIAFNDEYDSIFPGPLPATIKSKDKALRYIAYLDAQGGTEAQSALLAGMRQSGVSNAISMIFFITDGDVGNEDALIQNVNYSLNDARLFCIGIGSAPNSYLLRKVSKYGRGTFTYINSIEDVDQKIEGLLERIEKPILTDLEFFLKDDHDIYPNPIQDLYHDEPLVLFGRIHHTPSREHATLKGKMSDGTVEFPLSLDWGQASSAPAIPTLWARAKISELMDEYHLGNKTKKNEIIDLAIEHHLMTKFTSFVSVENQIVNPRSDLLAVAIPTDLPHGWNYDAIFGSPKIIPATFATNGNNGVQLASARTITLPQTGTNYPLIFLLGLLLLVIGTVLRLVGNMNQK